MDALERVKRAREELEAAERELAQEQEATEYPPIGMIVEIRMHCGDPWIAWHVVAGGVGFRDDPSGWFPWDGVYAWRMPRPLDGFNWAREQGYTHRVFWKDGGVAYANSTGDVSGLEGIAWIEEIPPEGGGIDR
jgi:hypothetical protein